MEPIHVGRTSRSARVAEAITRALRRFGTAEVYAQGYYASQQFSKALTLARSHLKGQGLDVIVTPETVAAHAVDTSSAGPTYCYTVRLQGRARETAGRESTLMERSAGA